MTGTNAQLIRTLEALGKVTFVVTLKGSNGDELSLPVTKRHIIGELRSLGDDEPAQYWFKLLVPGDEKAPPLYELRPGYVLAEAGAK